MVAASRQCGTGCSSRLAFPVRDAGLGSRLTGKLLRQVGSPKDVFRASLTELEAFYLPSAPAIQSKHAHKYAEEELAQVRKLGCRLLNWEEPEYPR